MIESMKIVANVCRKNGWTLINPLPDYAYITCRSCPNRVTIDINEKGDIEIINYFQSQVIWRDEIEWPYDVELASIIYEMMNEEGY